MDRCRQCHRPVHWDDATCPHCGIESPHFRDDKDPAPRRFPRGEEPDPYRHLWFRLVFPKYQRTGLFMMAVSVILVWGATPELRDWTGRLMFGENRIIPVAWQLLLVLGILFSLFHGVYMGAISSTARFTMLSFAIVANVLAGIASAIHTLSSATGIMLVFPIWNLINSLLLTVIFLSICEDSERLYEEAIVDRRVNRFVIGASYALILGVFFLCYQGLHLHWSYTFSICITVSTNFSSLVEMLTWRSKSSD